MDLMYRFIRFALLSEGKEEDLQKKYPSVDVAALAQSDPSRSNKYLDWMVKQAAVGANLADLVPTVEFFHQNIARFSERDINKYRSLKQLEDAGKELDLSKRQKKKTAKLESAQRIYEDDECVVIRPLAKDACVLYGSGTKWCITMDSAEYFSSYTANNTLFYFVLRKNPKNDQFDKVALTYNRRSNNIDPARSTVELQIFRANDTVAPKSEFLHAYGQERGSKILALTSDLAHREPKPLLARLRDREVPDEELMQLSTHPDPSIRNQVFQNMSPHARAEWLRQNWMRFNHPLKNFVLHGISAVDLVSVANNAYTLGKPLMRSEGWNEFFRAMVRHQIKPEQIVDLSLRQHLAVELGDTANIDFEQLARGSTAEKLYALRVGPPELATRLLNDENALIQRAADVLLKKRNEPAKKTRKKKQ